MSISKASFNKYSRCSLVEYFEKLFIIYANKKKNVLLEKAKKADVKCFTFKLALVFAF